MGSSHQALFIVLQEELWLNPSYNLTLHKVPHDPFPGPNTFPTPPSF